MNFDIDMEMELLDRLGIKFSNERTFQFSGGFNINGQSFAIKEIIYNDPATIVFWDDNTKTVAKCTVGDSYIPETGLSICILKKIMGGKALKKLFSDWITEDYIGRVTLADVRKKNI